jgi:hypothetical protein
MTAKNRQRQVQQQKCFVEFRVFEFRVLSQATAKATATTEATADSLRE